METIEHFHNRRKYLIEIYDNDDEMPIVPYVHLQKNYLIAAGVGTTIGDFDSRLSALVQYNAAGEKGKADTEIDNLRNLFWNIMQMKTPSVDAFSSIVHSINNKRTKPTEHGVGKTTEFLASIDFTMEHIKKAFEIKKKIEKQIRTMFPHMSDEVNIELFGATKRLQQHRLRNMIEDKDYSDLIQTERKNVGFFMFSYNFGGNEGDDVKLMAAFEKECLHLQSDFFGNVKELSVREYYTLKDLKKAA